MQMIHDLTVADDKLKHFFVLKNDKRYVQPYNLIIQLQFSGFCESPVVEINILHLLYGNEVKMQIFMMTDQQFNFNKSVFMGERGKIWECFFLCKVS